MRIHYTIDSITDNCQQKCPFGKGVNKKYPDVVTRVGSVTCIEECPFCMGRSHYGIHPDYAMYAQNQRSKEFVMREERWVLCAAAYLKPTLWNKVRMWWYHLVMVPIGNIINNYQWKQVSKQ